MLRYKNTLFKIFFTTLFIFISYIVLYNLKQKELILLSNHYYTENYTIFYDNSLNKWEEMQIQNGCRIFIEYNQDIRYYLKGNENQFQPPLQEGHFINSNKKGNQAVLGTNLVNKIKIKNGKKQVKIENEFYEVTGILDHHNTSYAENLMILKNNKIPKQENYKIILDGNKKKDIEKMKQYILTTYQDIKNVDPIIEGMSKFTGTHFFQKLLAYNVVLLVCFSVLMFLFIWVLEEKKEAYILYLSGISRPLILINFLKKWLLNIISSFVISHVFLFVFLETKAVLYQSDYWYILLSFLLFSAIGAISIFKYQIHLSFR